MATISLQFEPIIITKGRNNQIKAVQRFVESEAVSTAMLLSIKITKGFSLISELLFWCYIFCQKQLLNLQHRNAFGWKRNGMFEMQCGKRGEEYRARAVLNRISELITLRKRTQM